ncbi:hypothetical protein Tco_1289606 [Tanacetum coccineum]
MSFNGFHEDETIRILAGRPIIRSCPLQYEDELQPWRTCPLQYVVSLSEPHIRSFTDAYHTYTNSRWKRRRFTPAHFPNLQIIRPFLAEPIIHNNGCDDFIVTLVEADATLEFALAAYGGRMVECENLSPQQPPQTWLQKKHVRGLTSIGLLQPRHESYTSFSG